MTAVEGDAIGYVPFKNNGPGIKVLLAVYKINKYHFCTTMVWKYFKAVELLFFSVFCSL
jgi:hypothetical protein